jgi:hypothetical protein
MTLFRAARAALTGRSRHPRNWFRRGENPNKKLATRQTIRRRLAEVAFAKVTERNPTMPRSERRKLARAYAAKAWHEKALPQAA